MSLEKTFQNVEKLPEEKKLEVITSKEGVIKDLESHFEQNKYEGINIWGDCDKYFDSYMNFLKSFKLSPEIIAEFNTKTGSMEKEEALGIYLSALIQTSYNQGFNNFRFGEVNANFFGNCLKGKPEKPIKISIKELRGYSILESAENCLLKTKKIEGFCSLWRANSCLAEIQNYKGKYFGYDMENCTIKSKNKEILETIQNQVYMGKNNKFKLKK